MKLKEIVRYIREQMSDSPLSVAATSLSPFFDKYGIKLTPVPGDVVFCDSEHVRISISHERMSSIIHISIVPAYYADAESPVWDGVKNPIWGNKSLGEILYVLDPELPFQEGRIGNVMKTREEIMRQLDLLEQYCRPMLLGDFSVWPKIVEHFEIFGGPRDGETLDMWASRMRQILSGALKRQQHWLVFGVCFHLQRFDVELSREEKAAWREADRHI